MKHLRFQRTLCFGFEEDLLLNLLLSPSAVNPKIINDYGGHENISFLTAVLSMLHVTVFIGNNLSNTI